MRVAIVTESFLPQVNGVTNSVLRVIEHLNSEGHESMVIAPESEGGPTEYRGARIKRVPAIPLNSIVKIGLPIAMPSRKLEYLLDGFAPDVLHLASPFALGAYAGKVAKKLHIPTLSIYQTDIAGFARHYGLNIAHGTLQKLVGKIHANTDRTLAPSSAACADLRNSGVSNVHLWRRGVDGELFNPTKRDANLRRSWAPNGQLIVGYVGRLANEKRISDLAILDQDARIQLVIVGDGPAHDKLRRELPNAHFTGFKSGNDLASAYASFDLFIHPGPNETFCQAVQEALASGTPCIVPITGGPSDLVTRGVTGYIIDTSNAGELLSAVRNFTSRRDVEVMRAMARNSVVERSWSRVNQQLLNHYSTLIESKHQTVVGEKVA